MKFLLKKYKVFTLLHCNIYGKKLKDNLKKKKWKYLTKTKQQTKKKISYVKNLRPQAIKQFYKISLKERQKLKSYYGFISDRKLKTLYNTLKTKHKSFFTDHLLIHLEQQVGCILWRLKIFRSLFEIKQIINHGFVRINNQTIKNFHTTLKPGDVIWINPNYIKFDNSQFMLPGYLEWNRHIYLLSLIRKPILSEIQYPFKFNSRFIFNYLNNK